MTEMPVFAQNSTDFDESDTYHAMGVKIRPQDDDQLTQELADITDAERRAERDTATLRIF